MLTSGRGNAPLTDFGSVGPSTSLSSLNLDWRERDLPEHQRTKHVHRLHPYLGKFIPQLAEIFLRKYAPGVVCDPFCGSGTTLVEANALGINAVGCDVSAFNCLLTRVKTARYDLGKLEKEITDILERTAAEGGDEPGVNCRVDEPAGPAEESELGSPESSARRSRERSWEDQSSPYLRKWFATGALRRLLRYRSLISGYEYQDVLKIILSRSARSARLTTHFNLDFPKEPQVEPYFCHKHRRICRPTDDALQFLRRYSLDTFKRLGDFAALRTGAGVTVIHGDARTARFPALDAVITSPPYVGLIDYHEQHRYAYELLGLERHEDLEIGAAAAGNSRKAQEAYIAEIGKVFANLREGLSRDGVVVIVVHDRNDLYKDLAPRIGYRLEEKLVRHVNRRTGRRAGEFFEEILIWRLED